VLHVRALGRALEQEPALALVAREVRGALELGGGFVVRKASAASLSPSVRG